MNSGGRVRSRRANETRYTELPSVSDEEGTKKLENVYKPWAPGGYVAFRLLLASRMCAALWSNISDCDETYNYWEPMHYLLNGYGFQTWEYSPAYAVRSYAYLWLYAWPLKLHSQLFPVNKMLHFYSLRCLLALLCSLSETFFYRAVCRQFGVNTGRLTLAALVFAPGMFTSSTAFLPSSFAMKTTMMAVGCWYIGSIPGSIFFTALGALVGWPFTAALGIPIMLDVVIRRREIWSFIIWSLISLVVCLVPLVCIDSYYYGGLVVTPFNILMYNVFTEHGPNIYGVEPWSYYFVNCFLNFNIVFIMALLSLPIVLVVGRVIHMNDQGGIPPWLSMMPVYIWMLIFFTRPHKEERFLFPVYPLFCLLAAVFTDHLQKLCGLLLSRGKDTHYSRSSYWLALLVGIPYALASLSRIAALYYGYHAPLDVFGELQQRVQDHPELLAYSKPVSVCIGKEWYRFPSNFFLPNDRWQLQFLKSEFEGQLPKPYSRSLYGTRVFPSHMNDANREEPSRYVNITSCQYLVDVDFPVEAALEPRYSHNTKDWQVLISSKFLNSASSHRLLRAFFIPFVSRRYISYVNYNILVSTSSSKLLRI